MKKIITIDKMIIKQILIITLLLVSACCENDMLYIDRNFTPTERSLIYAAAHKINEVAGFERIEIAGLKTFTGDILNDDYDSITCEEANPGMEPHTGEAFDADIILYRAYIDNDKVFLSVAIHEMVHYIARGQEIGLDFVDSDGHINDENCIMAEYVDTDPPLDFCEKDIQFIRSVL
jgi:hypothetical protein